MLNMIDVVNTSESVVTDYAPVTVEPETEQVGDEIASLWSAHVNAKNLSRATNEELRAIRAKLGVQPCQMKGSLARAGRDGLWSGFLREHQIPRATADRLVLRHLRSLSPEINCISEEISEPTEENVQKLFASVWPKLQRTLRSRQSLLLFIDLLKSRFESGEADQVLVLTAVEPTICTASSDGNPIFEPQFGAVLVDSAGETTGQNAVPFLLMSDMGICDNHPPEFIVNPINSAILGFISQPSLWNCDHLQPQNVQDHAR